MEKFVIWYLKKYRTTIGIALSIIVPVIMMAFGWKCNISLLSIVGSTSLLFVIGCYIALMIISHIMKHFERNEKEYKEEIKEEKKC